MENFIHKGGCACQSVKEDDLWENTNTELNIVTECGHKPSQEIVIIINRIVKNKIDLLMKQYPSTEWLAYLIGDKKSLMIKDIIIPKQNVGSTHVHVTGPIERPDILGVMHSHHNMGAFFSGTDDTYINGNHNMSIVVAKNGSKALVRWETPCGSKMLVEGKIVIEKENLFDEVSFIQDAVNSINSINEIPVMNKDNIIFHKNPFGGGFGKIIDHNKVELSNKCRRCGGTCQEEFDDEETLSEAMSMLEDN